jgi:type VI secretion system protein ImpH
VHGQAGRWIVLRSEDRTQLQPARAPRRLSALGDGAVAGNRVWDRQSNFRIQLGPLSLADYERFLPGEPTLHALRDWVRQYLGLSLQWDVCASLRGDAVPTLALPGRERGGKLRALPGRQGRLGWTTWLGGRGAPPRDRSDLRVRPEREARAPEQMTLVAGPGAPAALG